MTSSNDRLTEVENDLETVKEIMLVIARRAEATDARIDRLVQNQASIQEQVDSNFKDAHGYQVDAIAPNGDRYCYGSEIFHSAASAEAKGREWIEDLREEDEEDLDPDE